MLYKSLAKPALFKMDAEKAHHLTIDGLAKTPRIPGALPLMRKLYGSPAASELHTDLWGIPFANPIGLAAGLDKNGQAVSGFSSIGFGFMEVGTVTPRPQAGNEKPRLFRLPDDLALVNRMGFNNVGADEMAANLRQASPYAIPVAVNIGKNKTTPNEQAADDYRACMRKLYPYGDFFVVNISSPNTPDLRALQHGDDLKHLLAAVLEERDEQRRIASSGREHSLAAPKPVLVKFAPDVTGEDLEYMVETAMASGISGIIATNTTVARDGLRHPNAKETGGLSGRPLTGRSTEVIRTIARLTKGQLPIVGCGGIFTAEDAYAKIRAGASLVEVYTALIYEGPELVRRLNLGLLELLRRDGFRTVSEAVGADVR
ncbi:dihydroorotate dehydrogenase (quinone) [Paenibacillus sp. J31TS4]|uniref:quinone-dependent dihydroorotate dehydrogenase n=1 Tax=Paenibacillus sp. J31TS4 TaxID=2807195 RepID=UPI001B2E71A5|nr:quinone-dependent dihydroorotate dehydrogenase [Paenibacillus sp. J31TS4]GIP37979.1 dihydroorotate dehydrogenase (quinone) [Paenibacillus sp. J31TS4]